MTVKEIEQRYTIFEGAWEPGPQDSRVMKLLIAGRWQNSSSGETFDVTNPADGSLVTKAQQASEEDVRSAIEAASNARSEIAAIPAADRITMLRNARDKVDEHGEALIEALIKEGGKPRSSARSEVHALIERLGMGLEEFAKIQGEFIPGDWARDTLGKMAIVMREPVGVVVAIAPFNYPLYIGASKIIPALLAGNAVVVKPPSDAPSALILFAKLLQESGLPASSINVVTGRGSSVGNVLVSDERVNMISFTGSTSVGQKIAQQAGLKKLHLELGGKGIAFVLPNADLQIAAESCAKGALKTSGQRCDAVSVVYAHKAVAEEFVQRLVTEVDRWKMGNPDEKDTDVGPLITDDAADKVERLVNDAVAKGATVLIGGGRRERFYQPTVLDNVPLNADIAWEETFGPVIPVVRMDGIDKMLEAAEKMEVGLDMCVFTNNFYDMVKIGKAVKAGSVTMNDAPKHGVGLFPFGGYKKSGKGREGIGYSIEEMTRLKTIVFNMEPVHEHQKKARREEPTIMGG